LRITGKRGKYLTGCAGSKQRGLNKEPKGSPKNVQSASPLHAERREKGTAIPTGSNRRKKKGSLLLLIDLTREKKFEQTGVKVHGK